MVTWKAFRKWLTDHDLPDPASAPVVKIELVPPVNLDTDSAAAVYIVSTAYKLDENGRMLQHPETIHGSGDFLTETTIRPLVSFPDETAE